VGGSDVIATTDGGGTWSAENVPGGVTGLSGISCTSSQDCWAVGGGNGAPAVALATTDRGQTWKTEAVPGALTSLAGISCTKATQTCHAVGATSTQMVILDR
jgi:photosystem II stability/assembly factor-like uncharacterized protein